MRLLITGAGGQLGRTLQRQAAPHFEVTATTREQLDIGDAEAVQAVFRATRPALVINAAAYTAVDRAESEPELAQRVNADGAAHMAREAARTGARLLHVSTDFVFDGQACAPYPPDASTRPLGVYGRSKRDGEQAVMQHAPEQATILRTAWVYGPGGHNFVRTMLRLLAEKPALSVVSDQIGTPTHTEGLAAALLALGGIDASRGCILHWTDSGVASWYDLAMATRTLAARRWPKRPLAEITPIPTRDWPTPAHRPPYSVLDTAATRELVGTPPHWQVRLERALLHDAAEEWLPEAAIG
ncbi:dTDP-4-dehydrorhamnose reductase [Algiphilus aromaticivorans]|uniref:dTDP-4-dehydrorhamnose reductase n=1 Tax=Algiphilus aromaticivorans TaxID=382454 RepID=UPI0005C1D856|nr:dTDP-4-dehydrorhamnose reductase [Algiphilus aromaticivorans]